MFRRFTTSIALAWVVVLFIVPLPLLIALRAGLPASYAGMSTGIGLGVLAYTWMLVAVYLAGRPRWVDRTVGLPHMYMIHGVLSILAIALAFVHALMLPSGGVTKILGDLGLHLFLFLMVFSLVFMAGWLSQRVRWVAQLKAALEKAVSHELGVWVHRLNLIAILLVFLHVQSIGFIRADIPFIVLFDVYTVAVFAWYVASKVRQRQGHLTATVAGVRPVADRTTELTLSLPASAGLTWNPGDFTFIRFPGIAGMKEYHPFSMINIPTEPGHGRGEETMLRFDIRADGDFTGRIAQLPVGAVAHVLPPYGRYAHVIEEHGDHAPLVMLAGGIGITPLLSLLAAYASSGRDIAFLYGARGEQDMVYADALRSLGASNPKVHVVLQSGGRFSEQTVADAMEPDAVYLIAGPYPMQKAWRKFLLDRGVPADSIYYEPFTM